MGLVSSLLSLGSSSTVDIVKARSTAVAQRGAQQEKFFSNARGPGQALVSDPYTWAFSGGQYVNKPTSLNYTVLKYLAWRDPIVAAIILTRLRQVVSFAQVRTHDETQRSVGRGFRVKLKDGNAKKRSKAVENKEDEFNTFMARCSRADTQVPQERHFSTFLWKFVQDRLKIDQASFEIQLDRKEVPVQFFALDGSTIRIAKSKFAEDNGIKYVQVYQERPVAWFTDKQLAFCPQNVSADLESNGYGISEIEIGIKTIMTELGAMEVNARNFTPGTIPRGFLTVDNAEMSEERMQELEMAWRSQIAGMRGFNHVPILSTPKGGKITFQSLPQSNDMVFAKFLDFVIQIMCALYGLDPVEIGIPMRGSPGMQGGALSTANEEAKLTQSRDKGLRPLLTWVESCINLELMPLLDPEGEFEFSFVGFDAKSDSDKADLAGKQVKTFKTVNEIREENGLDPLEDGDMILDGTYLQAKQGAQAMAQQGAEGEPGAEGAPAEGDGQGDDDQGQDWGSWAAEGTDQQWGQGGAEGGEPE